MTDQVRGEAGPQQELARGPAGVASSGPVCGTLLGVLTRGWTRHRWATPGKQQPPCNPPSQGRSPRLEGSRDHGWARASKRAGSVTATTQRQGPELTSRSRGHLTSRKGMYFRAAALLTVNQNNSSASLHIWVSRAASLSSGDRHHPRGRGQRRGQTGPLSHKARVSASIFCSPCKLSGSGS